MSCDETDKDEVNVSMTTAAKLPQELISNKVIHDFEHFCPVFVFEFAANLIPPKAESPNLSISKTRHSIKAERM